MIRQRFSVQWTPGPRVHFTRNWRHPVCNRALDCESRPVVSDPALLGGFEADSVRDGRTSGVCSNCSRLLTADERATRDRKCLELLRGHGLTDTSERASYLDDEKQAEDARRVRVHELMRGVDALVLVAHPDEGDEVLQHVYVHDPEGAPLFVGVCARHSERVLLTLWAKPLPSDIVLQRSEAASSVRRWPDVPAGYPGSTE